MRARQTIRETRRHQQYEASSGGEYSKRTGQPQLKQHVCADPEKEGPYRAAPLSFAERDSIIRALLFSPRDGTCIIVHIPRRARRGSCPSVARWHDCFCHSDGGRAND